MTLCLSFGNTALHHRPKEQFKSTGTKSTQKLHKSCWKNVGEIDPERPQSKRAWCGRRRRNFLVCYKKISILHFHNIYKIVALLLQGHLYFGQTVNYFEILVAIPPKFYNQLFCTKMFCAAFLYLQFVFVKPPKKKHF